MISFKCFPIGTSPCFKGIPSCSICKYINWIDAYRRFLSFYRWCALFVGELPEPHAGVVFAYA